MRHLTSDELVDLAEGARAESSLPHLAGCDQCRRQLAELRPMMSAAAEVEMPEPSPLFWDHFSERVHQAVAAEGAPGDRAWWQWWTRWSSSRLMLAAASACAIVVVGVVLATRFMAPASPPLVSSLAPAPPERAAAASAIEPLGASDDPTLGLVADLASSLNWDDASQLQVTTHAGGSDEAIAELTSMELQELQRLLKEEMEHPGA